MAYEKNKWELFNPDLPEEEQEDAYITKRKLDHIEDGIEQAHKLAEKSTASLQIGTVVAGEEASAEIVDGKLNLTLPKGADGVTPEKGVDYFTEEDKKEMVEAVLDTFKTSPYFDEEANVFLACGMHVNVDAASEAGKLRIHWCDDDKGNAEELIVPEGIKIFGGGASYGRPVYYPATSVTMNSGYVDMIIGGCFGNGIVGNSTVIINGGTFKQGVSASGMHWGAKNAHYNKVGHAELIINNTDGEVQVVYGGTASGVGSAGVANTTINGGTIEWLTAAGSNGYTSVANMVINGGTIKYAQGCNRGTVGNIKITVNGGTIEKFAAGADMSSDATATAKYDKVELFINGGTFKSFSAGANGGVNSSEKVSGKYIEGVITEEQAASANLTKTMSVEKLMEKIAELEGIIAN